MRAHTVETTIVVIFTISSAGGKPVTVSDVVRVVRADRRFVQRIIETLLAFDVISVDPSCDGRRGRNGPRYVPGPQWQKFAGSAMSHGETRQDKRIAIKENS